MPSRVIIFEDEFYADFYPMTHVRPVFSLRPGIKALYEKIIDCFSDHTSFLVCRPELEQVVSERTNLPVNEISPDEKSETVFINGCVIDPWQIQKILDNEKGNTCIISGERIIAARFGQGLSPAEIDLLQKKGTTEFLKKTSANMEKTDSDVKLYNHLWDLVNDLNRAIPSDIEFMKNNHEGLFEAAERAEVFENQYPGAYFINSENIYLAHDVKIAPTAVLDASHGPIYIEERVVIQPHTYLIGPAYIGRDTLMVGGKMEGCSIGPVCRVGGEVEETIIQGYTNKYHAGFLGHAYVGEWVNFGAMTTNSDLKNDYTSVKVSINGNLVDSGSLKVGSFIGDFTKTAIGTLLNTGINIGICCNIIGSGIVTHKEISNFTWLIGEHLHEYRLVKALEVLEKTMSRRKLALSPAMRKLLEVVHERRK